MKKTTLVQPGGRQPGVTLIELLIVMVVMGILIGLAIPAYSSYVMRVNRTEAISLLLQAAMCQERIRASHGSYDTGLCNFDADKHHYHVSYQPPKSKGLAYVVMATPTGAQKDEPCGSLLLSHDGSKRTSAVNVNETRCWNGR